MRYIIRRLFIGLCRSLGFFLTGVRACLSGSLGIFARRGQLYDTGTCLDQFVGISDSLDLAVLCRNIDDFITHNIGRDLISDIDLTVFSHICFFEHALERRNSIYYCNAHYEQCKIDYYCCNPLLFHHGSSPCNYTI